MNSKKYRKLKEIFFIKKKSIKNKYTIITNLFFVFFFFKKKENKFYLIVPKKNIKKSYLRNKIKRMIKNSFFKKKLNFKKNLVLLIIYKIKKKVLYKKIDIDIEKILEYIYYVYYFKK